jgi:hypothetical protein
VDFLIRIKAPVSFMFILAPRVGTRVREQLLKEGRIFDHDWTRYCGFKVVFHPRHMTARQLEEAYWRASRRFYSLTSILQRLTLHLYSWHMLPFNLYFAWCVRRRQHPLDYY